MHDYSIDGHPKEKILFVLAFLAIFAAPLLNDAISAVATRLQAIGWRASAVTAIPVFALFLAIYSFFNHVVWRWSLFRRFLLVPDLNGKWTCSGRTTLKEGEAATIDWNGEITITQSWSRILVHLKTDSSESKSIAASVFHERGVGYRLLYQYTNRPRADQLDLKNHSGATELVFNQACTAAEGNYFTDRHRNTVGTLLLRRADDGNSKT